MADLATAAIKAVAEVTNPKGTNGEANASGKDGNSNSKHFQSCESPTIACEMNSKSV